MGQQRWRIAPKDAILNKDIVMGQDCVPIAFPDTAETVGGNANHAVAKASTFSFPY
jgi:hypothetical protein